ncbi:MAG TPA: hypothetical protein VNL14_18545 [Candidatus Acidoferrales bacterium]|nr:hypothetical protein [Candidatus Acidoferrales bacterium]
MDSRLVKKLFAWHEALRSRPTLAILAALKESESLSPDELRELQWRRLKRLLQYAFDHTPYYRALFQKLGARPGDVSTPEDFSRLPILTKDLIRESRSALLSDEYRSGRGLVRNSTSGSTGEPLVFFTTARREAALNAAKLRGRAWWGLEIGDRELDFWGPARDRNAKDAAVALRDRMLNIRRVPAFDLSEKALERAWATFRRWKPRFVYAYPSAFFRFTLYLQERGVDATHWAPEVIVCSAENLYDSQRALFAEFFRAGVADEYGAHDGGLIAFECPAGRLHVNQEQVYVEALAPESGAPGGKLLITDLENYGQPFIRYQIGDYGELSDERCPCGRGLAVMRRIFGRATEMLRSTRGELVPGFALTRTFRDIPGVREFQVVQERLDFLRIRIVRNGRYGRDDQAAIERSLRKYLGEEMQFAFEFPPALERRSSGKCSWFVSSLEDGARTAA